MIISGVSRRHWSGEDERPGGVACVSVSEWELEDVQDMMFTRWGTTSSDVGSRNGSPWALRDGNNGYYFVV